jgi:hypothetical protein
MTEDRIEEILKSIGRQVAHLPIDFSWVFRDKWLTIVMETAFDDRKNMGSEHQIYYGNMEKIDELIDKVVNRSLGDMKFTLKIRTDMYKGNMGDYVKQVSQYMKEKGLLAQVTFDYVNFQYHPGLYLFPWKIGENGAMGYMIYDREDFEEQVWEIIHKTIGYVRKKHE